MVESNVNPKYQRIRNYLTEMSKNSNISDEFIERFVCNYVNKDQWVQSDILYEWVGKCHFKRYDNFVREIIRQLTIDSEYKPLLQGGVQQSGGRGNKTIYLISQEGLKIMAMLSDKQVRRYFIQCQSWLEQELYENISKNQQLGQDIQIKILKEQQFEETLQKYQHIQSLTINNQEIKMYGDIQNPLFLVNDITNLLGYDKIGSNRFYKDNKKNERYVMRGQIASSSIELQQRFKKSKLDHIYYFTELGLYRCLFQSQKPIAVDFQEQVAQLLKDIRLGNIQLLVQKECDFTNIIQDKNSELMNLITEKSALSKQINDLKDQLDSAEEELVSRKQLLDQCKKTCSLYKQKVKDNNDQIILEYAGSSINPQRRNQQHRSRSSNPGLREQFLQGKQVEFELIETFEYYTEQERKRKERELILTIVPQKRLNVQIPRSSINSN